MTHTDFSSSHEQVLEAALCAWEFIDEQTKDPNGAPLDGVLFQLYELRSAVGSPSMRYFTGQIAENVSIAFHIAETAAGGYYDDPFDFEFVPQFIARAVEVSKDKDSFGLKEKWRDIAAGMGQEMLASREKGANARS